MSSPLAFLELDFLEEELLWVVVEEWVPVVPDFFVVDALVEAVVEAVDA